MVRLELCVGLIFLYFFYDVQLGRQLSFLGVVLQILRLRLITNVGNVTDVIAYAHSNRRWNTGLSDVLRFGQRGP